MVNLWNLFPNFEFLTFLKVVRAKTKWSQSLFSHIMSKRQDKQDEVVKISGLQDIPDLFPTSAPSTPSVAKVWMKLPMLPMVCAEGQTVCDPQCYSQQNKVLQPGSCSSSRGGVPDPGSYPHSSCWKSLWSSPRVSYNALHVEWLSTFWGSGIPSSLQRPENLSSDEQDASPSFWWLQPPLHPKGVVSLMPPYRCTFSSSPPESIRS